jgi:hypothetical protein
LPPHLHALIPPIFGETRSLGRSDPILQTAKIGGGTAAGGAMSPVFKYRPGRDVTVEVS